MLVKAASNFLWTCRDRRCSR